MHLPKHTILYCPEFTRFVPFCYSLHKPGVHTSFPFPMPTAPSSPFAWSVLSVHLTFSSQFKLNHLSKLPQPHHTLPYHSADPKPSTLRKTRVFLTKRKTTESLQKTPQECSLLEFFFYIIMCATDITIFLAENYSMPFKKHQLQKKRILRFVGGLFFQESRGKFAFLMLATCSWEVCDINVLLKGKGGSFAPLLGDVTGLQSWKDNVASRCHFIMQSEVARTGGLHCNPSLLSYLHPETEKQKIWSVTTHAFYL